MQIHEITKRPLREGILGNIGRGLASAATGLDFAPGQASIAKDAAASAEKLRAQGYGQPPQETPVADAVKSVQQNPAQQQYIKGLVAQWSKMAPTAPAPAVQPVTKKKSQTATSDPNWRQDALKSTGAAFDQAPAERPTPGQMPAAVAASSQGQKMLQAYGQPRGGIQKVKEATKEYETPAGVIVPGGTKTDASPGVTSAPVDKNSYKDKFLKWAEDNLKTVEPTTRQTITLDQVLATDIRDELDRALDQVVATAGNERNNAIAVNNFLTIAVAGVARRAKELRYKSGRGGEAPAAPVGQAGQAIVTQQEIRNQLANAQINTTQFDTLKQLMQNPASKQALLKTFGVQA